MTSKQMVSIAVILILGVLVGWHFSGEEREVVGASGNPSKVLEVPPVVSVSPAPAVPAPAPGGTHQELARIDKELETAAAVEAQRAPELEAARLLTEKRRESATYMQQWRISILLFQTMNGVYPMTLEDLIASGDQPEPALLRCPCREGGGYVLCPPVGEPPDWMMVYEDGPDAGGKRGVLCLGGEAKLMDESDFQTALKAQMKAGK